MKGFTAALWTEGLKASKSRVFLATMLVFAFVAAMLGLLMFVAKHPALAGGSETIGMKASRLGNADWPSLFGLLVQTVLALGPIGYGIVTSWVFGREFADHTTQDLLALPTGRAHIVAAKFIVVAIWTLLLSAALFVVGLAAGWAAHLAAWSPALAAATFRSFTAGAFLTILLCTPIAFVASASRGYLLPIGVAILLLILTQFVGMGLPGFMPYFPWAIPAVSVGVAGSAVPPPQSASYTILVLTSLLGVAGTLAWWTKADQS